MLEAILDFLLPQECAVCRGLGGPICARCVEELPWLGSPVCDRCGAPMDRETCAPGGPLAEGVSRCHSCAGRRIPFRRARAALAYRAGAIEVVHALKYDGARTLVRPLVARAGGQWGSPLDRGAEPRAGPAGGFFDVDAVTFVPLTRRRQAQRGYNQAEVLACALADALAEAVGERPTVRPWLAQRRTTADQVGLDPSSRRANVTAAYALRAGVPEAGCRILLVDDVYTTGATAHVCAGLLRQAGWRDVRVWTLARVVRGAALHGQRGAAATDDASRPAAAVDEPRASP